MTSESNRYERLTPLIYSQVVGDADTSTADPNNPPFLEHHAFLWKKGAMRDLGTLGGINSFAIAIDSAHRVVGGAQTDEPDPLLGQQYHPFLWKEGVMRDLGTLGGSLAFATGISVVEAHESGEEGAADKEQARNTGKHDVAISRWSGARPLITIQHCPSSSPCLPSSGRTA